MCGGHTDRQLMSLRVSNSTRGTARKNPVRPSWGKGSSGQSCWRGCGGKGTWRVGGGGGVEGGIVRFGSLAHSLRSSIWCELNQCNVGTAGPFALRIVDLIR